MSQAKSGGVEDIEQARAIKNAYQAELMSKANVVGVGVGYRTIGGMRTDEIALVVLVTKKVPRVHLAPEDIVPDEIDGIPVDVQEVGVLRAE
jgi:hypothetical protein